MEFRKKKVKKQRGSKTHGYGSMKKHRGAGSRGGRGMAGTGKRGDVKKPSIQKNTKYFGKYGFSSLKKKSQKKLKTINIDKLEEQLPKMLEKKEAVKKGGIIFIDLKKIGYGKLLGKGNVKDKLEINVEQASKKAVEKIQKKGGKVNVLVAEEKPKKKDAEKKEIKESKKEASDNVKPVEEKPIEETKEEPEEKEKAKEVTEKETKE